MMAQTDKRFFISYSSVDSDKVAAVITELKADGLDVWFDQLQILPSDNIVQRIDEGLGNWKYFLLFASVSYFAGSWTTSEYRAAFYAAIATNERKIIVITLDDVQLPPLVAASRRIRYATPAGVAAEIRRVLNAVDIASGRTQVVEKPRESVHPVEWSSISDDVLRAIGLRLTGQRGVLRQKNEAESPFDVNIGGGTSFHLTIPALFVNDEVLLLELQSELKNFEVVSRIAASLQRRLFQGGLGIFEGSFEIELDERQRQLADIRATIRKQLSALSPELTVSAASANATT
jgi:hypothetical protein